MLVSYNWAYILPLFEASSVVSKPWDNSEQLLLLERLQKVVLIFFSTFFSSFHPVCQHRSHLEACCAQCFAKMDRTPEMWPHKWLFLGWQADISRQGLCALLVKWTGALVLATCCANLCKGGSRSAAGLRAVTIQQCNFQGFMVSHVDWQKRGV